MDVALVRVLLTEATEALLRGSVADSTDRRLVADSTDSRGLGADSYDVRLG